MCMQALTMQDTVSTMQQMLRQPGGRQLHPSSTEVLMIEAGLGRWRRNLWEFQQGNIKSTYWVSIGYNSINRLHVCTAEGEINSETDEQH